MWVLWLCAEQEALARLALCHSSDALLHDCAGPLQRSLAALRAGATDAGTLEVITLLATKPMQVWSGVVHVQWVVHVLYW